MSYMTYMQNIMENRVMAYEEGVEKVAAAMLKNNIPSDEESQHKYAEKTNVLFFVHRFGYYLHFAYNLLCDGCVFVFKAAFKPMSVNDA